MKERTVHHLHATPPPRHAATTGGPAGPAAPAAPAAPDKDRGDVPGWVLVTLMTAGLVLALWAIAGPALTDLFQDAISRVGSFGG